MAHGHPSVSLRIRIGKEAALRCYAPSTSVTVAILFLGYLTLRHTAAHALAGVGLATGIIIVVAACLFVTALTVLAAVTIRHRRAAAGACYTCSHPCREAPAPSWPHRPLTRSTLPIVVIPQQSPPPAPEMTRTTAGSAATGKTAATGRTLADGRTLAGGGTAASAGAAPGARAAASARAAKAARPADGHTPSRSRDATTITAAG